MNMYEKVSSAATVGLDTVVLSRNTHTHKINLLFKLIVISEY